MDREYTSREEYEQIDEISDDLKKRAVKAASLKYLTAMRASDSAKSSQKKAQHVDVGNHYLSQVGRLSGGGHGSQPRRPSSKEREETLTAGEKARQEFEKKRKVNSSYEPDYDGYEQIDELSKATMASYLEKAARHLGTTTRLSKDFERDYYDQLARANKHHPNIMDTPASEKDPEALRDAESKMGALKDLVKHYRRKAKNRTSGIARAGRLLAKPAGAVNSSYEPDYDGYEQIDERQTKVEYIKTKLSEAASKNLIAYLHAKLGADTVKSMSLPQYKAAKKEAKAEMKAAKQSRRAEKETQKAEAPPAKEKPENIIMQMRRIADLKPGHYPVKVSPVRSVNVHSDTARKIIGAHDNLEKPNDKRRFRIRVVQRMRKLDEEYGYFTSEEVEPIQESSNYTLYHKSYTDAINHALAHHEKSGLLVSDGDRMDYIGLASKKPGEGKTTSINIPATHEKTGKKHMIHIQVYNKGGSHPYELNTYSSPAGRPGRRRNEKS